MTSSKFNNPTLIFLASIPAVLGAYSLLGLSLEILACIALVLVASSYLITPKNKPVTRLELEAISETSALNTVDLKAHYFHLHAVLMSINPYQYAQNDPRNGPLVFHRLSISAEGLINISTVKESKPIQYSPEEARKIAKAIYQMAFACTLYVKQDVSLLVNKGIGHFLMKPFKALHPTPDVLHIGHHYNRISYFYERNNSSEYKARHPLSEENAAQLIQRAYRKRLFKQHPPETETSTLELQRTMQEQRITDKPTMHTRFLPLSVETKRKWLAGVDDRKREIAEKMLTQVVSYKSAAQFSNQLKLVVGRFNQFLHSLPADQREYILVVPNIGETKLASNHWVTALALPLLVKKPKAIVGHQEVDRYKLDHPELKYCVFIDDAVYSGRQLSGYVSKISAHLNLSTVLILPFYTRRNRIDHVRLQFLGEIMLTPRELIGGRWTKDDNEQFRGIANGRWSSAENKVGTFFFHKLPDDASSFLGINNDRYQALIQPEANGLRNY